MIWTGLLNLVNIVSAYPFTGFGICLLSQPASRKNKVIHPLAYPNATLSPHCTLFFTPVDHALILPPLASNSKSIPVSIAAMIILFTCFSLSFYPRNRSVNNTEPIPTAFCNSFTPIPLNVSSVRIGHPICSYKILPDKPIPTKLSSTLKLTILNQLYFIHNSLKRPFTHGVTKPCKSPVCITAANC